jgi:hypothetical protein
MILFLSQTERKDEIFFNKEEISTEIVIPLNVKSTQEVMDTKERVMMAANTQQAT